MPLLRGDSQELTWEEEMVIKLIRKHGSLTHSELLNKIMREVCCSMPEAEALVRRLEGRGLITRSGSRWMLK